MKKAFLLVMLASSILILFGKCNNDQEDDIEVETGSFLTFVTDKFING